MARREQGQTLFGPREPWLFVTLCIAALAALLALLGGKLTI